MAHIHARLAATRIPPVDRIVAILRGGRTPAAMLGAIHGAPVEGVRVRFRDDHHRPLSAHPVLLSPIPRRHSTRPTLIVDDVVNTGATLELVRSSISGPTVTMTLRGDADITVFPEMTACVEWPWSRAPAINRLSPRRPPFEIGMPRSER